MSNETNQQSEQLCECANWASLGDVWRQVLTGHHENCSNGRDEREAAKELVRALVRGIEADAADCDGISENLWPHYTRAKAALGEFDWKDIIS